MRVLIAPDKFAGTLTAGEAATAVAEGWAVTAPDDVLDLAPVADGGPGFVDVLARSAGDLGRLEALTVTGPAGAPVPAAMLLVDEADEHGVVRPVAYLEAAQACGLHLVAEHERDTERLSTVGVGELVIAALDAGARKVVVGLGGTATSDGGAGALAALGAVASPPHALRGGSAGLVDLVGVDLAPVRATLGEVELVAATDVDAPLLGERGAAHGYAPQKGADEAAVERIEAALTLLVHAVGRRPDGKAPAVVLGAGAGGGLGFGLVALGATRVPGIATVLDRVRLEERVALADLVVTGEGAFDWQSLRGKTVAGVASVALALGRPVIVLAGRVDVGRREYTAIGISAAYAADDGDGRPPARALQDLATRVARTWGG